MKAAIKIIKAITLLICLALLPGDAAFAQKTRSFVQERKFLTSAEVVFEFEQMLKQATKECDKVWLRTYIATSALDDGNTEKAKTYAQTVVTEPETTMKNCGHYGRAIHYGNLVLGHIALASGNIAEAKLRLIAAGKPPGAPRLNSFGPNMSLARELLEIDERAVVIEYLDLCTKFWKDESGDLHIWKALLEGEGYPDLGHRGDNLLDYNIDAQLVEDIKHWIKIGKL